MAEAFQYAVQRVVPRIERAEFVNAGVVLYCPRLRFLDGRWALDSDRLAALDPGADAEAITAQLAAHARVIAGDPDAGAVAALAPTERFGWLTAPSSTVVQSSPIHSGVCADPAAMLEALFTRLVARPRN